MKALLPIACLAMFTPACAEQTAADPAGATSAQDMTPTAAMPFVAMAGASDLYEIESSRIALEKSQMPEVRTFAQMMIDHHTMTTQQVMAAAQEAGLAPPPPALMPMQADMIAQLRHASSADFDRMYRDQQLRAHEMALALHANYARNGDTAPLKRAAATAEPIVQRHLDLIRQSSGR